MNIDGLGGYNPITGAPKLFVAYGNDIVDLGAGTGYNQNLTAGSLAEFASLLDAEFMVNGVNTNRRYLTASNTWVDETARKHAPIADYILSSRSRIFLANINMGNISGLKFQSRVWFSDLPRNNDITYGLEYGTDLAQTGGSPTVSSASAFFKTRNIKPGDPFTIVTGANAGEYIVFTIDSETQITLVDPLISTATGSTFYTGRNYFDVNTNNSDVITGIAENDSKILVFKRRSLYRFDGNSERQVKGVPGTTSHRSIANVSSYTFYFHETGIWRYGGLTSELASRAIQDYIDGMDPAFYGSVVGWTVGNDIYRVYIGNVNNADKNLVVPNCILDYDTATQSWSPGKIADEITAKTDWIVSDSQSVYLGTTTDEVLKDNSSFLDNNTPIEWSVETGFFFPVDPDTDTEMISINVHVDFNRGGTVLYKLYGTPTSVTKEWLPLGDIKDQITTLPLDRMHQRFARGINIKVNDIASGRQPQQPGPVLTRIAVFHRPRTRRVVGGDV